MVFRLSKTTGFAAGLSVALSLLGTQAAHAAQFFDFTVTYQDGSQGSGSFSIDDTPDYTYANTGYYGLSYEQWFPVQDLTYTYLGQTYNNSPYSYFMSYEFPDGEYYSAYYGSSAQDLFFYTDNTYNTWVSIWDAATNSGDFAYTYNSSADYLFATSFTLTERTTDTQSVPEPGTIAGLALTGVGFLATRRKKRSSVAPLFEKVCS